MQKSCFLTKTFTIAILLLEVSSFTPVKRNRMLQQRQTLSSNSVMATFMSNNEFRGQSRIEGNQRQPTIQELSVIDEMITKLSNAKPYELPSSVQRAFRVVSSPRFFLRIAERADQEKNAIEKEKLSALASNLVATLEAVVSTTEDKLDENAKYLERVVKAAAEPDSGEFLVPLLPQRIDAMRKEFNKLDDRLLDEGFLITVDSWINKSYKDGMDLMVGILQKVLQLHASRKIAQSLVSRSEKSSEARKLFIEMLETDAENWGSIFREKVREGLKPEQMISEIQSNIETIVFSLETGSMSQWVLAEYLKEMIATVEKIRDET